MHFARPENLYWLLVLVPMVGAVAWYWWWQRRVRDEIGDTELVEKMADSRSTGLRATRIGLALAGVALLCLAAAQPQWGRVQTEIEQEGIDLVFALDLSKSMLARDIPPTRLEAASGEIKTILDRLDGDRAGMVVFTTVSFVQSPLTGDYGALRFYLDKLNPSEMSVGGTAIGSALRDSVELLTGESLGTDEESSAIKNAKMDRAENQLVVLFTDGEDHESDPVAAAETARDKGVHVVTVGVGSEEGAKIPVLGPEGDVRGYKRDRQGNPVQTVLQEGQLREVADAGGGVYMPYTGDDSVADGVLQFVEQLQTSKFGGEMTTQYRDRFMWFLVPGTLLLLISFLLGERRRGRLGWSRESAGTTTLILAILLGASSIGCDQMLRSQPDGIREGNDSVQQGNFEAALESFDRAEETLEDLPPEFHYNRGLAHLGNKAPDKARSEFARGLESPDAAVRFDAHFNIGLSFARDEEWKSAAEEFENGFRIYQEHPDAIDAGAVDALRHNTELAYRKLYPPCRTEEDDFEENDSLAEAARLEEKSAGPQQGGPPQQGEPGPGAGQQSKPGQDLTLCGLDDDWFAVDAIPGSTITVETTYRKLGDHPDPEHTFLPAPEDLGLELVGADGETLASDRGDDSTEGPIQEGPVERTIEEFVVGEETPLGDDSQMYVRLAAADQLKFTYDIDIQVQPPCRALEEDSEDNDTRAQTSTVEDGKHQMQACPGDPDWVSVDAEMGDSVFIDVQPMKPKQNQDIPKLDPSDIDLEMVDAETGETVGNPRREGSFWTAGLQDIPEDRSFDIGVRSADGASPEGPYQLRVYVYPPCIVGDDRHEENDTVDAMADLPKKQNHYRYLRLCPDDPDHYAAVPTAPKQQQQQPQQPPGTPPAGSSSGQQQPDKSLRLGLRRVTGASAETPEPTGDVSDADDADEIETIALEALDASSGDVLQSGEKPETGKPGSDPASAGDDQSPPYDRVLHMKEPDQKKVPVRVTGEPTFYHLEDLSGQNNQSNKQNDSQSNDQQNQSDQSDQNDQNDEQNDQSDSSDQNKDQKQNDQQNQDKSKKNKQKQADRKQKQESADQKRMEDILKALEDSDANFQMRKAMEDDKNQDRKIEKDW